MRGCIPGGSDRTLHVGAAPCMLPGGGGGHARGNQDQRGGEQDRGFQSRTYGSGRGACDETYVPTANDASSSRCSAARRRGGAAAAWPIAASAQQPAMPVVGFLHSGSPASYAPSVASFLQALSETGYVEGRNVTVEYRWAEDRYDRLPALAADLVQRKVAAIAAGGPPAA